MEPVRGGEQHPLQNPLILRQIFEGMSLNDLKSSRQVCREWCQESTAVIVMREVVPVAWITNLDCGHGRPASDFLELMRGDREENAVSVLPFKVYLSCSLEELPREFWDFCGAAITKMHLSVESSSRDAFRHAVFESCTNLKALKIEVRDGENVVYPKEWVPPFFPPNRNLKSLTFEDYNADMRGVSWMEIMNNFPSVERFEAHFKGSSLAEFFASLALTRRDDDQCWKLNHLWISMEYISTPLAIVPVLEDLNLSLKTLVVKWIRSSKDAIALRRIFAAHAPTLKALTLYGGFEDDDQNQVMEIFPLPNNAVFENVTKLHLGYVSLNSVSFLKSFPNLKMLEFQEMDKPSPQFTQESVGKWISGSCKELKLDDMEHFSPEDLKQLLGSLINVEKLTVQFCMNDEFAVICEVLTNLVELRLPNTLIDDAGISGLTVEEVETINETEEEFDLWPNMMVAKPNISRLTKLQRFEWPSYITERSVPGYVSAVIVQQLPKLQHIRIPDKVEVSGLETEDSPPFVKLQVHPLWERLLAQFPWPWPSKEESPSEEEWPHNT